MKRSAKTSRYEECTISCKHDSLKIHKDLSSTFPLALNHAEIYFSTHLRSSGGEVGTGALKTNFCWVPSQIKSFQLELFFFSNHRVPTCCC